MSQKWKLRKASKKFIEEEGRELAKAIIGGAVNKAGFGNTFKMANGCGINLDNKKVLA